MPALYDGLLERCREQRAKAQALHTLIRAGEDRGERVTELRAEFHRASGMAVAYFYVAEMVEEND